LFVITSLNYYKFKDIIKKIVKNIFLIKIYIFAEANGLLIQVQNDKH